MRLSLALSLLVMSFSVLARAGDPADSWLSYAAYSAGPNATITMLNATWKVPSMPQTLYGSNAPGWWFGVQTADGNGALIQPILAFADGDPVYTIFNGVFDWNDGSWYQSDSSQVNPGQTIYASVLFASATNTYTMLIGCKETGWSVTSTKKVHQGQVEAVAYFVVEHQPDTCSAYPASGEMTFTNIYMEVEGQAVKPAWQALQEDPACNSKAIIISPTQIQFSWDISAPDPVFHPQRVVFGERV